jgi:hypothetical protein
MIWLVLYLLLQSVLLVTLSDYRGKFKTLVTSLIMPLPTWVFLFLLMQIETPCEANPKMVMNGYCDVEPREQQ